MLHYFRPLSKLHLITKIALFGIFFVKFFDHVTQHALKIFQKICSKTANFIAQSEFRKKSFIILSFLTCPLFLYSAAQDSIGTLSLKDPKEIIGLQLKSLDHLIAMSKVTLSKMEQLHASIDFYQKIQNQYLDNIQNKELLFRMTKMADQILQEIKSSNLTHAFDMEFLNELSLLSKIYRKNELPKL